MHYNPFRLLGIEGLFTSRVHKTAVKDIPYGIKHVKGIPKGCRMYYFNSEGIVNLFKTGEFNIPVMALNEKNARRKLKNLEIAV